MTAIAIVQQHGFQYSGDCSLCGGRYQVYKNPSFPDIEIKVKKSGGRTKIYRKGQLIVQTVPESLELVMNQKGL